MFVPGHSGEPRLDHEQANFQTSSTRNDGSSSRPDPVRYRQKGQRRRSAQELRCARTTQRLQQEVSQGMSIRYCANKDLNRAVRELVRTEWTFRRRSRHGRLIGPAGACIAVATTPSDRRGLANFRAEVRRASR